VLSDVAWRANPNFRAERGLEIGLHGNWVGITPAERELLGQALFTCFGGGTKVFPGGGALSDANATQAAIGWGLALRLAQRIGAGTAPIWARSRLGIEGEMLTLSLRSEDAMLYGAVAERRHRQLANFHGLTHQMQIV
jgi:exopolyphosphatase/guanosine-5'-triphosphate,3'-diphosphate pyrophosphatase